MKRNIGLLTGAIVIMLVSVWIIGSNKNTVNKQIPINSVIPTEANADTTDQVTTPSTESNNATKSYTIAEIAQHKDQASCWTAVNGKVYDLTSFLSRHKGGMEKIMTVCGVDGTDAFTAQHAGQEDPQEELVQHYIGDLKK